LDECADLLERHGGHALAAGFTARTENVPELMRRLQEIAARELVGLDLRPVLRADLEIPLAKFRSDYVETVLSYLDKLQPTGQGNPEAVFVSRNLEVVKTWTVGGEKQHLRLKVRAGNILYDAIAFRQGHLAESLPKSVDLMYMLEKNEYNGYESLQLNVRDIRPAENGG
jgi:single-stranded-DNA-specific exonuclease